MQIAQATRDVDTRSDTEHSASIVPQAECVPLPPEEALDSVTAPDSAAAQIDRQLSFDSSIYLDSDEDALTLVVQTSGASAMHDCVHSSNDQSPVRSPQDTASSQGATKGRVKVKKFESESRDVLRALPLDSELRFASMVAAAQQAAAVALAEPSPRDGETAGCGMTPRNLSAPRGLVTPRNLRTPRSARTPHTGRTPQSARGQGSKRDRKVTSSKKKKALQKQQTQQAQATPLLA